jgi:serine/threonine-protein kinase
MSKQSKGDELPIGYDFGGYEIVGKLGAGAFGAVYEALKLPLRKRTALKVLHREFVRHHEVVQRFLREAEIVAQIDHPHIVGVFDVGVFDEQPYIAMEFLDGESLAGRLKRETALPREDAVDLLLAVMSAVATVHEKGIVHRDLKPDNIFIAQHSTGGSQPKLLDFGMSPEQAQESKHIDASSDQWSLAVILFECLTGRCPFQGDSLLALLNAITAKPIPRLRELSPTMPEGLDAAIYRAMDRTPSQRWPTVRAFGAALLPFASVGAQAQWATFYGRPSMAPRLSGPVSIDPLGMTGAAHSETLEPATRSSLGIAPKPRRRGAMIAGVAASVLVFATGGVWLASRAASGGVSGGGTTAALARPTTGASPVVPTTLIGAGRAADEPGSVPAPSVVAPIADAGVAAPIAAPIEATAVAADPVPEVRVAHGHGGHHGHGPRPPTSRPPRNCPNGICAPD